MEPDESQEDLDLGDLSVDDLEQCGLSLGDIEELQQTARRDDATNDHADLIAELRAIHSGSDIDENDLKLDGDLKPSDEEDIELPSDVDDISTPNDFTGAFDVVDDQNDAELKLPNTAQSPSEPETDRKTVIENEIKELQIKAVQLNRAGKKPEALQAMAKIRRLKELLSSASNGGRNLSQLTDTIDTFTIPRPDNNISKLEPVIFEEALSDVTLRLQQFTTEALRLKRSGLMEGARALIPTIVALKDAKAKLEKGATVDISSLPQWKATATETPSKSELFDSLERDLKNQVTRVYEEAKQALKLDLRDEARVMMAIKIRTERELEALAQIRTKNDPLPIISRNRRAITYLRQFEHVGSNQLELEILKAEQLSPPSGWKLCSSFVSYELNYPKDVVQKGVTQTITDSDDPVYGFKKLLSFPRPKRAPRMFNFVKIAFSVQVPRMVLFKPIVIGTAELKLGDLLDKSEILVALPLKGGRGKLRVVVRLRNPLSGQDFCKRIVEDLSIQSTLISSPSSETVSASPTATITSDSILPRSVSRQSPKASPAPHLVVNVPTGISEEDWNDPHRVSSLRSNDVMQWVLDKLLQTIGTYRAKRMDPPSDLLQQFQQVSALKQQLEQQVEEGTLTLPAYLNILRDDIKRLTLLQAELAKAKRGDDAQMILSRLKIEQDELNTALSAGSSES